MDEISKFYEPIKQANDANNAWSAAQAQKAMDYQTQMSNTAHQREVADLKAAGLNPVLSAGGTGASTTSGVAASAGQENITAMYGLMAKAFQAQIDQAKAMENTAKVVSGSSGSSNPTASSSGSGSPFGDEGSLGDSVFDLAKDILKRKFGLDPKHVDIAVDAVKKKVDDYKGPFQTVEGKFWNNYLKNNTRSAKEMASDPYGYDSDPWFVKVIQSLNPKNRKQSDSKFNTVLASVKDLFSKASKTGTGSKAHSGSGSSGRGGSFSGSNGKYKSKHL